MLEHPQSEMGWKPFPLHVLQGTLDCSTSPLLAEGLKPGQLPTPQTGLFIWKAPGFTQGTRYCYSGFTEEDL